MVPRVGFDTASRKDRSKFGVFLRPGAGFTRSEPPHTGLSPAKVAEQNTRTRAAAGRLDQAAAPPRAASTNTARSFGPGTAQTGKIARFSKILYCGHPLSLSDWICRSLLLRPQLRIILKCNVIYSWKFRQRLIKFGTKND